MSDNQDKKHEPHKNVFLVNLRKSGILENTEVNRTLDRIRKNLGTGKISEHALAERFVSAGLLTNWQTEKLIRGRYKGFLLGKYKLLDHLGTGGMSSVYLAEHNLTGQKRAIKVLPKKRLAERSYLSRFYREGRAVAGLNHPNIVRIYDIAGENNTHYMVMEYVDGSDLFDLVIENGPTDFELARQCVLQAAQGLAHAHENNMVHRDIKPANLLLTESRQIKVLDLGLALLKYDDNKFGLSAQNNERMLGTVDYLAPEQAVNSHEVDLRADIYGLGCTLYFLLTGQPPFTEGTLAQRIAMHQTIEPTPISEHRKDCPSELVALCQKMMAKDPDDRFQNCNLLIDAFENGSVTESNGTARQHSNDTGKAQKQDSESDRSNTYNRRGYRKKSSMPVMLGLGILALTASILGFLVFQNSKAPTENKTIAENTGRNNSFESNNSASVNDANRIRHDESPKRDLQNKQNLNSTNQPIQNQQLLMLDFDKPDSIRKIRDNWELLSGQTIFGTLLTRRKCNIVEFSRNELSQTNNKCLLLQGNSSNVEFRPIVDGMTIATVRFNAQRQGEDSPFTFLIQAKPSITGPEKWKTVTDLSNNFSADRFNQIEINQELFDAMDSRKFRFKIESNTNNGVYIDDLSIELK